MGSIRLLERDIETHTAELEKENARTTKIENEGLPNLRELSVTLDQEMGKRVTGLEALLYANEEADKEEKDKRESETAARLRDKIEIMARIDGQANDIADTNSRLQKTGIELEGTGLRVHNLEEAIPPMTAQIEKLGGGLDLTHEYWRGLTKGFKETHRSIAVDNEMLPQKGMHTTSLPALANTASTQGNRGNRTAR